MHPDLPIIPVYSLPIIPVCTRLEEKLHQEPYLQTPGVKSDIRRLMSDG